MPGTPRPVADERDALLVFLAQQRDGIRFAAHGLDDKEASLAPTVSALCLAGLVKHVAAVERYWVDVMLQRATTMEGQYEDGFRLVGAETLESVLAEYAAVAAETERAVAEIDLSMPVPVPQGVPWFPDDVEAWSARWVLLHIIQETARHAGHADIVREGIDGKTMYELMAAAEEWPSVPWEAPAEPA